MHRMRHTIAKAGLVFIFAATLTSTAAAARIRPSAGRAYPDIAGALSGTQSYSYDPATQTGRFQASNTPYLLMLGSKLADEYNIQPNPDGVRSQVVNLTLNHDGRLVPSPSNSFALYGTVAFGGQTYQGLLLQATPTAFGAQAGQATGGPAFDLNLTVTGGALAQAFGPDVFLTLRPSPASTFDGAFTRSFATTIESTSTIGTHAPTRPTGTEPTTIVVILACGSWLIFQRGFRRIPIRELEIA